MKIVEEPILGVKILKPFFFEDERGCFVKPFHENQLAELGIKMVLREEFYSTSEAGVLRGMHFQTPPHAHSKLIYCIKGRVTDVVLDLRRKSPTYGQSVSFELSAENKYCVFIPEGFAHGFYCHEDDSCLVYKTDAVHAPIADAGIAWNSFQYQWPKSDKSYIMSERDQNHPSLEKFTSPFE